jgi:hypothetical protein
MHALGFGRRNRFATSAIYIISDANGVGLQALWAEHQLEAWISE